MTPAHFDTLAWSPYQSAIFDVVKNTRDSLVVNAVAGSGKTTTIVEAAKRLPPDQRVLLVAFNKSIVTELQQRISSCTSSIPRPARARSRGSSRSDVSRKSLVQRLRWLRLGPGLQGGMPLGLRFGPSETRYQIEDHMKKDIRARLTSTEDCTYTMPDRMTTPKRRTKFSD